MANFNNFNNCQVNYSVEILWSAVYLCIQMSLCRYSIASTNICLTNFFCQCIYVGFYNQRETGYPKSGLDCLCTVDIPLNEKKEHIYRR